MFESEQIAATAPAHEAVPETPTQNLQVISTESDLASKVTLAELIASQLATFRDCHAEVLERDAEEAIHKMRVTTRRLQASLDLIRTGPLESDAKKIKRRIRRWRRMLSDVRNYDVFLALVTKEALALRPSQRAQFDLLSSILARRRQRCAGKIKKVLHRISIETVASRLGVALPLSLPADPTSQTTACAGDQTQTPISGAEAPGGQDAVEPATFEEPAAVLDDAIEVSEQEAPLFDEAAIALSTADRLDQRLAEFELLAAQSHPARDPKEFHQLRIAAKRLRYLMEITSALGYGAATAALAYLKLLQDRIGEWHDLHALEEEIVGIVARPKFLKKNLAESSSMLRAAARLQKKKEALISRLFPIRVPKTVPSTSNRLATALRRGLPPSE